MTALTGWLVVLYGVIAAVSGLGPAWFYVPEVSQAHASVVDLETMTAFGIALRSLHHYSAHGCLLLLVAHFVAVFVTRRERLEEPVRWLTGVIGLALLVVLLFSGRVLPWDQHAGVSLRVALSFLGPAVRDWTVGIVDCTAGLLRVYWIHLGGTALFAWLMLEHVRGTAGLQRLLSKGASGLALIAAGSLIPLLVIAMFVRPYLGPSFQNSWALGEITSEWYLRWVEYVATKSGWVAGWGLIALVLGALTTPWWGKRWGAARARVLWCCLLTLIAVLSFLPLR